MKNSLHLFTAMNSGIKFPFALEKLTAALPIASTVNGGTILYGVGVAQGIQITETPEEVTGLYNDWFKSNAAGVAGRVQ